MFKFMMDHPGIVLKFLETNEIDEYDKKLIKKFDLVINKNL